MTLYRRFRRGSRKRIVSVMNAEGAFLAYLAKLEVVGYIIVWIQIVWIQN